MLHLPGATKLAKHSPDMHKPPYQSFYRYDTSCLRLPAVKCFHKREIRESRPEITALRSQCRGGDAARSFASRRNVVSVIVRAGNRTKRRRLTMGMRDKKSVLDSAWASETRIENVMLSGVAGRRRRGDAWRWLYFHSISPCEVFLFCLFLQPFCPICFCCLFSLILSFPCWYCSGYRYGYFTYYY